MRSARDNSLVIAVVITAALLASPAVPAQSPLLSPGARVRVSAPDLEIVELEGRLVRLTADSLTIDVAERPSPISIPVDKLSRLDVSTGKYRRAGAARGAKYGSLFGALAAMGVGLSMYGCEEYCAIGLILYGAGGAVAGLVLGTVVGAAFPLDRWQEVSPPSQPSGLGQLGARRAIRVGLTIAF